MLKRIFITLSLAGLMSLGISISESGLTLQKTYASPPSSIHPQTVNKILHSYAIWLDCSVGHCRQLLNSGSITISESLDTMGNLVGYYVNQGGTGILILIEDLP